MKIAVDKIKNSPFQVRSKMNGEPFDELKSSIKEIGLAVPVKVRPVLKGYELVYGHRRLKAVKGLGQKSIEAIVEELTDEEAMLQGLVENVQREDLEPMEEAKAYKRLKSEFGWTIVRIASEIGKGKTHVATLMSLLDEPKEIQDMLTKGDRAGHVEEGTITERHVRAVRSAGLPEKERVAVLKKAATEGLPSHETGEVAEAVKASPNEKVKEHLLKTEFSDFVHDPKRVEKLKEKGGIDPTIKSPPKIKIHEQAVANFLRYIKQMGWWVDEFDKVVDANQLSPEAKPFVVTKLKPLRDDINRVLDKLEK